MAIPWLVALKVIPWGEVIEHAPKVLEAARKLLDRQRKAKSPTTGDAGVSMPSSEPPSLALLQQRMVQMQQQIDGQAQAQDQQMQTLAELAEQNAQLVHVVELLRVRTRLLLWGLVLLALVLAWEIWR